MKCDQSNKYLGLSWWLSGKESTCQCKRQGFNPPSTKIPKCCGATKSVHHNYWACTLEPDSCNYWAYMLRLQKPARPRTHAPNQEKSFVYLPAIWASLVAQLVKNLPAMQETLVWFLGQEDLLEKGKVNTPVFFGFPCGSAGIESTCKVGDLGSIPGLERSPGEGKGYLLQYSGLENFMDYTVHGVSKSWTQLQPWN